jgi:hypothetical protein
MEGIEMQMGRKIETDRKINGVGRKDDENKTREWERQRRKEEN